MNIALVYALVALFTIVIAGPVALLAPVFFAAELPDYTASIETNVAPIAGTAWERVTTAGGYSFTRTIEQHVGQQCAPSVVCAPFVRVYAGRGESRPAVHPWSLCQPRPAAYPLSRTGKPLKGAAMRGATAKANRIACVSHACPTVRL